MKKCKITVFSFLLVLCMAITGCTQTLEKGGEQEVESIDSSEAAYEVIDNNEPSFTEAEMATESFETYSELDSLGRCGVAYANIGRELMPTEERGSIGMIKPSGWQTIKYENVDGKYLYNRCHLIGYQLTGENANEKNLITGTRYMNVQGMLPFEDEVADYVRETGNHVLYRVTPDFQGDNLVVSGVEMEAKSVEDQGAGVSFHVYVYNRQPGIWIDYANGDSQQLETAEESEEGTYIINKNTWKFHKSTCSSVSQMKESNKLTYKGDRQKLMTAGYEPCKSCNP